MQIDGMIIKAVAGMFEVYTANGILNASAAGKFRNKSLRPAVGDRVEVLLSQRSGENNFINEIKNRKNELIRPQIVNVDTLVIVLAVKKPEPDLLLVDRLVCCCRNEDIKPVICVNKSDYCSERAKEIAEQYEKSGIDAVCISAEEKLGIERLKEKLSPGVNCLCGQSAVGKSTITNLLLGRENFAVGGLSRKTDRGKHTTRHCELVCIENEKWLADTPGFSLLELPIIAPEKFMQFYNEFDEYSHACRFNGCSHVNEPNCAVKTAVSEGKLSLQRYERYKELFTEINEKWRKRYD